MDQSYTHDQFPTDTDSIRREPQSDVRRILARGTQPRNGYAMVRGQAIIQLLAACDKSSSQLQGLTDQFQAGFELPDSHVVSFFEIEESPIARLNGGRWCVTGDSTLLVNRCRPRVGAHWQNKVSHLHRIDGYSEKVTLQSTTRIAMWC